MRVLRCKSQEPPCVRPPAPPLIKVGKAGRARHRAATPALVLVNKILRATLRAAAIRNIPSIHNIRKAQVTPRPARAATSRRGRQRVAAASSIPAIRIPTPTTNMRKCRCSRMRCRCSNWQQIWCRWWSVCSRLCRAFPAARQPLIRRYGRWCATKRRCRSARHSASLRTVRSVRRW